MRCECTTSRIPCFLSRRCFYFILVVTLTFGVLFVWYGIDPACFSEGQAKTSFNLPCQNASPVGTGTHNLGVKMGYALAFRYWEQQTQASNSLLQLQCFVNSQGLQLVEPFVHRSSFSLHFDEFVGKLPLRFSDLVDVRFWNRRTEEMGFGKLATWEDFVAFAPRAIVTACIKYRDPGRLHQTTAGFDFRTGCSRECMVDGFNNSLRFLNQYGFKSVRSSCTNFVHFAGAVNTEDFTRNILGSYQPGEVTVMMNEFRGFFGLYRAEIRTECGLMTHSNVPTRPSASIMDAAGKYIQSQFYNQPYVAVLIRVERIVLHLHQSVDICTDEVSYAVQELVSTFTLSHQFLAMDVGRFGSNGARTEEMVAYGASFLRAVYGERRSFDQWEASFENSSLSSSPAYVASLQRTIASKARCLVLVGGGGFQLEAKSLYLQHHTGHDVCVRTICSTPL